jgi:hypothetical protein
MLVGGCGQSSVDTVEIFYGGARAFGPIQWRQKDILDGLQSFIEGKGSDLGKLRKAVQDLEFEVKQRRQRLAALETDMPQGASVAPLLESCRKQVEVAETVFLPQARDFLQQIEKEGDTSPAAKLRALGNGRKCFDAMRESERDLSAKFKAFEQEFEQELRKAGRLR